MLIASRFVHKYTLLMAKETTEAVYLYTEEEEEDKTQLIASFKMHYSNTNTGCLISSFQSKREKCFDTGKINFRSLSFTHSTLEVEIVLTAYYWQRLSEDKWKRNATMTNWVVKSKHHEAEDEREREEENFINTFLLSGCEKRCRLAISFS